MHDLSSAYGRLPRRRVGRWAAAAAVATLVTAGVALPGTPAYADSHAVMLDNDRLRFGGGGAETASVASPEASVSPSGTLRQPFYWSTADSLWYQLTYSSHPLDIAVGAGTGGGNWHGNAEVIGSNGSSAPLPTSGGVVIDASGFSATDTTLAGGTVHKGHGTVVSTVTVNVDGRDLEIRQTYVLGPDANFVRTTTRLRNLSDDAAENVNLWVGTTDDYVGAEDQPAKRRGNIVDGEFRVIDEIGDHSNAIEVTSGGEGVLFYSTTSGTYTLTNGWSGTFVNQIANHAPDSAQNPITRSLGHDGSYGIYLPVGDLDPGATTSIVWYYAAGTIADLGDIVSEVSADSGGSSGGGGGGSGGSRSPSPEPEPPSATSGRPVTDADGGLPALPAGQFTQVVNGSTRSLSGTVLPDRSGLQFTDGGVALLLEVRAPDGSPIPVDPDDRIVITPDDDDRIEVSGSGLPPGADVDVWIFSEPALLGSTVVASDGTFRNQMGLPGGISPGIHTLQLNVFEEDGSYRSVAIGVIVAGAPATVPAGDGGLVSPTSPRPATATGLLSAALLAASVFHLRRARTPA